MKRIKLCLCLLVLMFAGCTTYERVERHHYHGGATLQYPEPVRIDRTITIEVRR